MTWLRSGGVFWLYAAVAVVHVVLIVTGPEVLAYPTKLLLMPVLAVAVLTCARTPSTSTITWLLLGAIAFSWLGDGAATFFPFDDELPPMLACFGIAHLLYIWLFAKYMRQQPFPRWAAIFVVWWVVMVALLWPHLGTLAVPVAAYGLVLGGTAAFASRCGPIVAAGGVFFLISDTILSVRIFVPEVLGEAVGSPAVMATYALGQGLIAWGVVSAGSPAPAPPRGRRDASGSPRVRRIPPTPDQR